MSDLMLHGVLNMPMPDDPSEMEAVEWLQFRERAKQASQRIAADADRIEKLEAVLHKLEHPSQEVWLAFMGAAVRNVPFDGPWDDFDLPNGIRSARRVALTQEDKE